MRTFYDRHRNGNATTEDFLAVLDQTTHRRLEVDRTNAVAEELAVWLFSPGHPQIEGRWFWRDGRLVMRIDQVQPWAPFSVPLTIGWDAEEQPERRTVQLSGARQQEFSFETTEPGNVELDPDVDLLLDERALQRIEARASARP